MYCERCKMREIKTDNVPCPICGGMGSGRSSSDKMCGECSEKQLRCGGCGIGMPASAFMRCELCGAKESDSLLVCLKELLDKEHREIEMFFVCDACAVNIDNGRPVDGKDGRRWVRAELVGHQVRFIGRVE